MWQLCLEQTHARPWALLTSVSQSALQDRTLSCLEPHEDLVSLQGSS